MFATAPLTGGLHRALPMSWWAALSLGAAAIHFAVIPAHFEEWWAFGVFFAVLGWFQAVWPFAYLDRPTRSLAWIAIVANLATVILWAWSRTAGLPVGPEPGMPEAIGAPDVVATALELALVVGLLVTQVDRDGPRSPETATSARTNGVGVASPAVWILVAVLTTVAIALGGG